MMEAVKEALKAQSKGEVPIGAVIADLEGRIISKAHNTVINDNNVSSHAEINAIKKASSTLNNYRLTNTVLYSTVEPCVMCMGAVIHARIKRIVFGTHDIKWGAAGSLYSFHENRRLNHMPEVVSGVLEDECRKLIQNFFKEKRRQAKEKRTCPVLP